MTMSGETRLQAQDPFSGIQGPPGSVIGLNRGNKNLEREWLRLTPNQCHSGTFDRSTQRGVPDGHVLTQDQMAPRASHQDET